MKKAFAALLVLSMLLSAVALAESTGAAGTWYLIEVQSEGQTFNPADFGMEMTLVLNEDGTAAMNGVGDEPSTGTWTIDGSTVTVTIDDDPLDFALEDGKLTASQDNLTMVFSTEPSEAATFAPAAPVEAAAAEDFAGTWNAAKIGLEGTYYDAAILGADVTATFEDTTVTLDGFMFSNTAIPLEFADGALSFSGSDDESGMQIAIKASLLEDGMLALDLDAGETGAFTFYMNRAEAEAAA